MKVIRGTAAVILIVALLALPWLLRLLGSMSGSGVIPQAFKQLRDLPGIRSMLAGPVVHLYAELTHGNFRALDVEFLKEYLPGIWTDVIVGLSIYAVRRLLGTFFRSAFSAILQALVGLALGLYLASLLPNGEPEKTICLAMILGVAGFAFVTFAATLKGRRLSRAQVVWVLLRMTYQVLFAAASLTLAALLIPATTGHHLNRLEFTRCWVPPVCIWLLMLLLDASLARLETPKAPE